jgi:8-oxo-dGTP pyrophosphatase MutT (NUDIX family)
MGGGERLRGLGEVPILPAATVVVLRPAASPEVLLVKRSSRQAFMPELWVFPGGRVDESDHAPEPVARHGDAFRAAAVRETLEEARIALEVSAPAQMPEFACWVTPVGERRRFHTRFFVAMGCAGAEACPDVEEVVDARWLPAQDALALHAQGALALAPPTWWTLHELAPLGSHEAVLAWARAREAAGVTPIEPVLDTHEGRPAVRWTGGGLWLRPTAAGAAWAPIDGV